MREESNKQKELLRNTHIKRKDELSLQDGCILWGTRVIVLRNKVLSELHDSQPGISRMKNPGSPVPLWPGMERSADLFYMLSVT